MRMLILTAAALTLPTAALADPAKSFTHDGQRYDYTVTEKGSAKVITGTVDGTRFRYVIRGGRVRGVTGSRQVSFDLDDVKPIVARVSAEIAAR